jgi:hypothetical protein
MNMLHISNTVTQKSIYFTYFYSIMKDVIFLGGYLLYSNKIFTLQKRAVTVTTDA